MRLAYKARRLNLIFTVRFCHENESDNPENVEGPAFAYKLEVPYITIYNHINPDSRAGWNLSAAPS